MRRTPVLALALFATFALAACASQSNDSVAPDATAPTSEPAASEPAAAGGCAVSNEAAAVSVGIENFAFVPPEVSAAVGETIGWTNSDSAGHTATLDDGACETGTLAQDASVGLVFDAAGTYPYHCAIHPTMTGTITITE
jgi:plastocyanin